MITALESLPTSIAHLRIIATPVVDHRIMPFGIPALDDRLASRGLRAGALHEVAAQSCSMVDDAAATLFLAGIAAREAAYTGGPVLWVSCRNDLYAPGLEQAGLSSADLIHAQPRDDAALLAVVEDAGDGPERIHGEWWRRDAEVWAVRDYYRVEDDAGGRYWVFRRGDGFVEDTGDLSWWMHGVFA